VIDLEQQQLVLRYEHLRMRSPDRERRLIASLAAHGQQLPIVVIAADESERFVVVDGYKRVHALRRLAHDTVRAACWELDEAEALLLGRLIRAGGVETAFEQGLWLQELHQRFGMGQETLARRFDRSVSWVSRRLALVRDLPESIQRRVLQGEIVAHAAMKYLVPLARANSAACSRLVDSIAGRGLTTRQVGTLVTTWRAGSAKVRALVLSDPLVVLKTRDVAPTAHDHAPAGVVDGLLQDLAIIAAVARRAHERVCEGAARTCTPPEREEIEESFRRAARATTRLGTRLQEEHDDAGPAATHDDPGIAASGNGHALDRADAHAVAGHGA
jgi:ParB/RepB/Spo0J family partition protein